MAEHGNFFFKFLKFFFLFVFNLKNLPKWISCQTVVSSHENTHPSKGGRCWNGSLTHCTRVARSRWETLGSSYKCFVLSRSFHVSFRNWFFGKTTETVRRQGKGKWRRQRVPTTEKWCKPMQPLSKWFQTDFCLVFPFQRGTGITRYEWEEQ